MARRPAPSMPTKIQVKEIFETVKALHPGARIKAVGPDGVTFDYPDVSALDTSNWKDKPFTGAA